MMHDARTLLLMVLRQEEWSSRWMDTILKEATPLVA